MKRDLSRLPHLTRPPPPLVYYVKKHERQLFAEWQRHRCACHRQNPSLFTLHPTKAEALSALAAVRSSFDKELRRQLASIPWNTSSDSRYVRALSFILRATEPDAKRTFDSALRTALAAAPLPKSVMTLHVKAATLWEQWPIEILSVDMLARSRQNLALFVEETARRCPSRATNTVRQPAGSERLEGSWKSSRELTIIVASFAPNSCAIEAIELDLPGREQMSLKMLKRLLRYDFGTVFEGARRTTMLQPRWIVDLPESKGFLDEVAAILKQAFLAYKAATDRGDRSYILLTRRRLLQAPTDRQAVEAEVLDLAKFHDRQDADLAGWEIRRRVRRNAQLSRAGKETEPFPRKGEFRWRAHETKIWRLQPKQRTGRNGVTT